MSRCEYEEAEKEMLRDYFFTAVEIKQEMEKQVNSVVLNKSLGLIAKARAQNEIAMLFDTLKNHVKQTKQPFFDRLSPNANLAEIIHQELSSCQAIAEALKAAIAKHSEQPKKVAEKKKQVAHKPSAIKGKSPEKISKEILKKNSDAPHSTVQESSIDLFSPSVKRKPAPIKSGLPLTPERREKILIEKALEKKTQEERNAKQEQEAARLEKEKQAAKKRIEALEYYATTFGKPGESSLNTARFTWQSSANDRVSFGLFIPRENSDNSFSRREQMAATPMPEQQASAPLPKPSWMRTTPSN